ncbi:MAG TPA: zf-HC2 domain-containing protein [Rubrivivax sp.]|nr:zf-HC2 domain-containing protein [Rubrivivax sp.]HPO18654.1 zf-HC2 domain-containing protein [Rubrivivax sp.]
MRLDCREAARLVLAGEDRRLRWRERAGLRLHLLVCAGCRGFVQQVALMRQALQRWRDDPTDPPDAGC